MSPVRVVLIVFVSVLAAVARAQNTVPTVARPFAAQALTVGSAGASFDLREYFLVPGVSGQVVQFDTVSGRFNVEMLANAAPRHVANFMTYVSAGDYANTFIHRTSPIAGTTNEIIQGGGYRIGAGLTVSEVATRGSIALEYNLANARGTLAAARTSDVNSATSGWFINVRDNSTSLGPANGGGYSVFGRVLGTGMAVVDAIAALPHAPNQAAPFAQLPVRNYAGSLMEANLIIVRSVTPATIYPTGTGASILSFAATSSDSAVVTAATSASGLTLTAVGNGSATVTVRATDTNGGTATGTIDVTVTGGVVDAAPKITVQPISVTVAAGGSAALTVAASGRPAPAFQWRKDGALIGGATGETLLLSGVTAAQAGRYTATATNPLGSETSAAADVAVAAGASRLANLSVRANLAAAQRLIVGFATNSPKSVLLRGIGPTLGAFGVGDALADPKLELFQDATKVSENDNWEAALAPTFAAVGAFGLTAGSRDAALQTTVGGSRTAQITGPGAGVVLVEVYDAGSGTAQRLVNVSARNFVGTGDAIMIAGFVVDGPVAKTLLIRAVGPTLAGFGVGGALADPKLEIFRNGAKAVENDDWSPALAATAQAVGAFALLPNSRDAALLVTLPPGAYSAQVSGIAGGTGEALVEVYEVP